MKSIKYNCDICGKEAYKDQPVYNLIWQEQTTDGSDGDLDQVVGGVSTIYVCGVCALKVGIAISETLAKIAGDAKQPETSPTCCQPGRAEDPESDQKEPESVQKEAKPVRKRIDAGKVVALYKAGWKQKDIAEEIGCSESVISTCLKKARAEGKV